MTQSQSSPYRVLARKYRPQTLEQLVGQEVLVKTLTQGIERGRLPQAFLFHGIRGVGKTTTARILAKALNCVGLDGQGGPTPNPCGGCSSCLAIAEDRHLDVVEMDAASHTGVDDVREVIEAARYKAVNGRYKIYIIDEVHMLSKSAFNALLKTLEEPPPHVKFIFATTELRKIPDTVLSRCMRFDLSRIDPKALLTHLQTIAHQEKITVEDDALTLIVRAGDGSARDSLSLFDQAIALSEGDVTTEIVRNMLGLVDRGQVFSLLQNLLSGQASQALNDLREIYQRGGDPLSVLLDLMDLVYWVTCLKTTPSLEKDITWPEQDRRQGMTLASQTPLPILMRAWQVLNKGYEEAVRSPMQGQAVEMILVRLGYLSDLPSAEDLLATVQGRPREVTVSPMQPVRVVESSESILPQSEIKLPETFSDVLDLVIKAREPILHSHLVQDVHLVEYKPGHILMRLAEKSSPTIPQRLREILEQATKTSWIIDLSGESGGQTVVHQQKEVKRQLAEEARNHPLVDSMVGAFPGATVTIKE